MTRSTKGGRALVAGFLLVLLCGAWATSGPSASARSSSARGDFAGAVDIGNGRRIYAECRGRGSPAVVLISGKGNGARDWHQVLDPADPVRRLATDEVLAGKGDLHDSPRAVYPTIARETRVCAYDRPDVRDQGKDRSTPEPQPHTVDQDVDDLHRVLEAIHAPQPYVLVAHSYGGLVAELYARTYPDSVGGLVMVDAASSSIDRAVTPDKLAVWDEMNRVAPPGHESVELADAMATLDAAPPLRHLPAVVLTADKPLRADLQPDNADASVTFDDWLAAQQLLATELGAPHVTKTKSGHNIYLYSPQLVNHAIREVVTEVRDQNGT